MELQLEIDRARPLRVQLEARLREAVRDGRLPPGARLPSTRGLASALGVSRGIVVEAYGQLAAEGYLSARQGAGTQVAAMAVAPAAVAQSKPGARIRYDVRVLPDLESFPRRWWLRAASEVLHALPAERLGYGDATGAPELRVALAAYLGRTRGLSANPDHLVIPAGLSDGLAVLWRVLRAQGARRIAVEDPGWRGQADTLRHAGLEPVPVPVDEDGLVVEALEEQNVSGVIVSPAHQFPTGAVLAPTRRTALVEWARRSDALIVEDDYDAQYRYDREPVGALQGLAPDRTVHGGSVSKILAPAIRLGWLLLPAALVEPVRDEMATPWRGSSVIEQLTLARLIESGELDRHLRKTRRLYRRRRDLLFEALENELPELAIRGAPAGLHLILGLPEETDPARVVAAASERGVAAQGFPGPQRALLVGYGGLPEPSIKRTVKLLAQAIRASAGSGANL